MADGRPISRRRRRRRRAQTARAALAGRFAPGDARAGGGAVRRSRGAHARSRSRSASARCRDAATPRYELQRYTLADFRGDLEEIEPAIRDLVAAHPARPVFRCVLAHLDARLGRTAEARTRPRRARPRRLRGAALRPGVAVRHEPARRDGRAPGRLPTQPPPLPAAAALGGIQRRGPRRGLPGIGLPLPRPARDRDRQVDGPGTHFSKRSPENTQMGARPWLAYTQAITRRCSRAATSRRSRARADPPEQALATFAELGMQAFSCVD